MAKRGGQVRKSTKRVNRKRPRKSPPRKPAKKTPLPKPRKKPAPKPRKQPRKGARSGKPPVPTRRQPRPGSRPSWVDKPVLGPFDRPLAQEAEWAAAYCRKWLTVHDWALDNAIGDVTLRNGDPRRRIAEGLLVKDMDDSEEAAERGIPLQDMHIDAGPGKDEGGIRRVVIRLLTWVWDVRQQSAYQPQWGQFGTGMTVREAVHQFNRYVADYANAVTKGIESRRLVVTGMAIVWWTSAPKELNYV